jgi:hypothetical protein
MTCTKCEQETNKVSLEGNEALCDRCKIMYDFNHDVEQNTLQPIMVEEDEVRYVVRIS